MPRSAKYSGWDEEIKRAEWVVPWPELCVREWHSPFSYYESVLTWVLIVYFRPRLRSRASTVGAWPRKRL